MRVELWTARGMIETLLGEVDLPDSRANPKVIVCEERFFFSEKAPLVGRYVECHGVDLDARQRHAKSRAQIVTDGCNEPAKGFEARSPTEEP